MKCFAVNSDILNGILSPLFFIAIPKNTKGFVELLKIAKINPPRKKPSLSLDDTVPYVGLPETDNQEIKNIWIRPYREVKGRNIIREGDILFARIEPSIFNKKYIFVESLREYSYAFTSTEFYIVEANKEVNPKYLFYMFYSNSVYNQVIGKTTGSTGRRRLDKGVFEKLLIPYPSKDKQDKIVTLLDSAYRQKKQKEAQARKLLDSIDEYILQELDIKLPEIKDKKCFAIDSAYIKERFDPAPYHPVRIETLKKIKSSPHNQLQLKDVVEFKKELVVTNPNNLVYIGLENIESKTGLYIASDIAKKSFGTALRFQKGDVLFPKLRPYLNKVYLAQFDGICSTEFCILTPKVCNGLFLRSFLSSRLVVNQTSNLMTGNTLPRLQTDDIENLIIPLPSSETQAKIAEEAKRCLVEAEKLIAEADSLSDKAKQAVEAMILGK